MSMKSLMGVKSMMCGGCGHTHFSIGYKGDDYHRPTKIIVFCDECGSESSISTKPVLVVDFAHDKSNGCLCPE